MFKLGSASKASTKKILEQQYACMQCTFVRTCVCLSESSDSCKRHLEIMDSACELHELVDGGMTRRSFFVYKRILFFVIETDVSLRRACLKKKREREEG